jgi:hypothetical protein
MFCGTRVEYVAGLVLLGCRWNRGWVLLIGFFPWNLAEITIVHILVVPNTKHTFISYCKSVIFLNVSVLHKSWQIL